MRTEEQAPVAERYLWLDGIVSSSSLKLIEGLPKDHPPNSRVCFVGFSYADLPLPRRFDMVFDLGHPEQHWEAEALIVAATQQYGIPWDSIPHGWKTICVIVFPEGVPAIVDAMPRVGGWYESKARVGLCDRYAYPEVLAGRRMEGSE